MLFLVFLVVPLTIAGWYTVLKRRENNRLLSGNDAPPPEHSQWGIGRVIVLGLVFAVVIFVGIHIISAYASRGNPPAMCQLLGGHWDAWNGWRCG